MQRTHVLLTIAIVTGLSTAASAQVSADAGYCDKLIGLYRTYVNNPEDPKPAFRSPVASHETAIASCKAGNPGAGIPVLEKTLRDNKFTLPPRGES